MISTLTLNPALDLTLEVKRFSPDDSIRVSSARKDPGGKGFNVSRVVKRLGYPTAAIGFLGGQAGQEVIQRLGAEGIYVWHIPTRAETRVNVTISQGGGRGQIKLNQRGPYIRRSEWQAMCALLTEVLDHAQVWVLSGSLPPGLPSDTYAKLIRMARKINSKLKVAVDADGPALAAAVKQRPYLVKPNIHELNRLMGTQLNAASGWHDLTLVAQKLRRRGPRCVLLSLGGRGALWASPQGVLRCAAPPVKVRSSVGAGDSLLAGFVTGLAQNRNETAALRLGMACAAATVMQSGTQLASAPEIRRLLSRIKIC